MPGLPVNQEVEDIYRYVGVLRRIGTDPGTLIAKTTFVFTSTWPFRKRLALAWMLVKPKW